MSRNYDNWERLVEAVMCREQLRQLSLDSSRSPSTRSLDSDFSFSSSSWLDDISFRPTPSPLHPDAVKLKLASSAKEVGGKQSGSMKEPRKRRNMWKGLSIFRGFSSKKDYSKEERERQWTEAQRTLHGLDPMEEEINIRRAEIARLRELHTFKAHIESILKLKGLDMDSIPHYFTL